MADTIKQRKAEQKYNPKPRLQCCRECIYGEHFYNELGYMEAKMRCKYGDFAVKPRGICKLFKFGD